MPSFNKAQSNARQNAGGDMVVKASESQITEPRCHVCTHKKRKIIDRYLAKGESFSELSRIFGIDRRSISNHYKSHLNLEDAAIAKIIEREAVALDQDFEEGIRGILARRVYLETALKKAQDALLNGDITVEPKDAVAIIEKLDKMEGASSEAAIAQMRIELASYIQAMKEIVPETMWDEVIIRTRDLVRRSENAGELGSGS